MGEIEYLKNEYKSKTDIIQILSENVNDTRSYPSFNQEFLKPKHFTPKAKIGHKKSVDFSSSNR